MERLKEYFGSARTCSSHDRKLGIETESLFVDPRGRPISKATSRLLLRELTNHGWIVKETKNDLITCLEGKHGTISYELGWNNLELATKAFLESDRDSLFQSHQSAIWDLREAGKTVRATMLTSSWDKHMNNTLMAPDQRDEIWLKLDGPALFGLGHIACIHFNVDLVSIGERMEFINDLLSLYTFMPSPAEANEKIWRRYVKKSWARYEPYRYGPPPTDFETYCATLAKTRVVMNRGRNGDLEMVKPPQPFSEIAYVDIDLFLRSIWWWFRLRVRNGTLVLEIRDINRNAAVSFVGLGPEMTWLLIASKLGI